MIDPTEILTQLGQGPLPDGWDVFEGKRPSAMAMGCFLAIVTVLILTMCSFLGILAVSLIRSVLSSQPFHLFSSLISLAPIVGAVIAIIALGVAGVAVRQTRKDSKGPDPIVVVTPNGFVEYFVLHKPPTVVSFADLADVQLEGRARITRNILKAIDVSLYLYHKDDKREKWHPEALYEDDQIMRISIATAYEQYAHPENYQKWKQDNLKFKSKKKRRRR